MADAQRSGRCRSNPVEVQVLSSAPTLLGFPRKSRRPDHSRIIPKLSLYNAYILGAEFKGDLSHRAIDASNVFLSHGFDDAASEHDYFRTENIHQTAQSDSHITGRAMNDLSNQFVAGFISLLEILARKELVAFPNILGDLGSLAALYRLFQVSGHSGSTSQRLQTSSVAAAAWRAARLDNHVAHLSGILAEAIV